MGIPLPKDAWIKDKIITMASIVISQEFNYALFSNEQIKLNGSYIVSSCQLNRCHFTCLSTPFYRFDTCLNKFPQQAKYTIRDEI